MFTDILELAEYIIEGFLLFIKISSSIQFTVIFLDCKIFLKFKVHNFKIKHFTENFETYEFNRFKINRGSQVKKIDWKYAALKL